MSRWILDAGAFVAFERGDTNLRARIEVARRRDIGLATTSPVVAQVWRNRRRQVLLARLVAATQIEAPDLPAARRAGELLARTRTRDVVDALLVGLARTGDVILTSDPDDIAALTDAARVRAVVIAI
jgi:hypothetical protein